MIYLDYSATTPVSLEVIDTMNKVSKDFIGNANSLNALGKKSSDLIRKATDQIAEILACSYEELTYTSGATEANNLALIGVAMKYHKKGKHIIVSKLEHPSIYEICKYLTNCGFEIEYVNNNDEGLVDFDHLKSLIRKDTILVSIALVNSELGIRQPLKMIRQIIRKENPETILHSDMTQGLGKFQLNTIDVDLASFSSHKIYGPKGIGLLYKSNNVKIVPLEYGSGKTNLIKPGTPPTSLIAGFSKAVRISNIDIEKRKVFIQRLNDKIKKELLKYEGVQINSTKYSIPQVLNITINDIKSETFIRMMDEKEIYLSTNTACSSGDVSSSVMALYNDKKRAESTIRISLSYQTSLEEVNKFIKAFDEIYKKLSLLK